MGRHSAGRNQKPRRGASAGVARGEQAGVFACAGQSGAGYSRVVADAEGRANAAEGVGAGVGGHRGRRSRHSSKKSLLNEKSSKYSLLKTPIEILFTCALVVMLYLVWNQWWTGIVAAQEQIRDAKTSSWSAAGDGDASKVAEPQSGEPPVQPAKVDASGLIGQIYIPAIGDAWTRNIVQGTDLQELNMHGFGHYEDTQMPGEAGNFAIAGHSSGYGAPGGELDKLKAGAVIVVRTQNYWYVYELDSAQKVLPEDTWVIAPNPKNPSGTIDGRWLTITTCWPKYQTPTHRYIVWAKFKYWANVADGTPKELLKDGKARETRFSMLPNEVVASIPDLKWVVAMQGIAFGVVFIAASVAWRFPAWRSPRTGSMYGVLYRHLPGIAIIRVLLLIILSMAVVVSLFQWVYPWMATNIPLLRSMSSFA